MKTGIVTSSKKFKSVERNRMKRIVRKLVVEEINLNQTYNCIIIIRRKIYGLQKKEASLEFARIINELNWGISVS